MAQNSEANLYLTQIKHLEEALKSAELRHEELQQENKKLSCQYNTLKEDRQDISEYLLHRIALKQKEVQELQGELERQKLERHKEEEALKLQLSQKRRELQEQEEKLRSKEDRLAQQKEQIRHVKEQQSAVEEKLKIQAEEHKAAMESLILKSRCETEKKLQEAQDLTDKNMLTREQKRFQASQLQKNIQSLSEELSYLTKERDSLTDRRDKLQGKIDKKRTALSGLTGDVSPLNESTWDLSGSTETEEGHTSKPLPDQIRVIWVLKLLYLGKESKLWAKKCDKLEEKLKNNKMHLQKTLDVEKALREQQTLKSEQLRQVTYESQQLDVELQRETDTIEQLEASMRTAAAGLRLAVKRTTLQLLRRSGLSAVPYSALCRLHDSQKQDADTKGRLQRVLQVLEGPHPGRPGTTLDDSAEESSQGQKPQTSSPETASAESPDFSTDPVFLMARYRTGDLGIVPRPAWSPIAHRRSDRRNARSKKPQTSADFDV
ncbi:cilia- and flagella-associated protein 157-like [Salarias fasciatus]|uniref:cilia- and flagella-associated protein 157-like n=1 Tax=Salarias fasciatus TaxID=181472 RepID=UPI0011765639|nr:cilia- and flagella-associated protein 157-like [Salarias fasciatus]